MVAEIVAEAQRAWASYVVGGQGDVPYSSVYAERICRLMIDELLVRSDDETETGP
jgi:hypothetical protein